MLGRSLSNDEYPDYEEIVKAALNKIENEWGNSEIMIMRVKQICEMLDEISYHTEDKMRPTTKTPDFEDESISNRSELIRQKSINSIGKTKDTMQEK